MRQGSNHEFAPRFDAKVRTLEIKIEDEVWKELTPLIALHCTAPAEPKPQKTLFDFGE